MIARRPSIAVIGTITDNGTTVVIAGWQLGLCAARCTCHRHPVDGHLAVLDQPGRPVLGLVSYRPGCDCCDPWTADELTAVVRDLADVETLATS